MHNNHIILYINSSYKQLHLVETANGLYQLPAHLKYDNIKSQLEAEFATATLDIDLTAHRQTINNQVAPNL
jgi:hypothetical protein